jgi:alkanesulfonate monooxygenase SsuD/methylene tetrahydromethanopterin reductase-like flavin-dependent oxidoreductase (luciferase family)
VARYGDACNLIAVSPEHVAHKLDVLRRHWEDAGRDGQVVRIRAHEASGLRGGAEGLIDAVALTRGGRSNGDSQVQMVSAWGEAD